jgi:hypothetical protein
MTAKTYNGNGNGKNKNKQRHKQIPFGDDKRRNNGKGEIQGSLHCATDGGAVRRFGRDDVPWGGSLLGTGRLVVY